MKLPELPEGLKWDLYKDEKRGLILGIMPIEGYEWAYALSSPLETRIRAFERKIPRKDKELIVKIAEELKALSFVENRVLNPKARRKE